MACCYTCHYFHYNTIENNIGPPLEEEWICDKSKLDDEYNIEFLDYGCNEYIERKNNLTYDHHQPSY